MRMEEMSFETIPVIDCDARQRESVKFGLITLLEHVYDIRRAALVR